LSPKQRFDLFFLGPFAGPALLDTQGGPHDSM
jgi:hypothetical protein